MLITLHSSQRHVINELVPVTNQRESNSRRIETFFISHHADVMAPFGRSGVDGRKACNKSRISKELRRWMNASGSASISESLNVNFMEKAAKA